MAQDSKPLSVPPHIPQILKHLGVIPSTFDPETLGPVVRCVWDGVEVQVPKLTLSGKRFNALEFFCPPPTPKAAQMDTVIWGGNVVTLETAGGFRIEEAQVVSWMKELSFGSDGQKMSAACNLYKWTALQGDDSPSAWVAFAGIVDEPVNLRMRLGNLLLEGYPELDQNLNWLFRGSYTVLLVRHQSRGWFVVVDTGSPQPPRDDILTELTLIGYLIGHPLHLHMFHRVSATGTLTGYRGSGLVQIGNTDKLSGTPIPGLRGVMSVEFFDKIMAAVKQRPELDRMVRIPIGHHFEGHGRSIESQFSHAWIAAESLAAMAEFHGFVNREKELVADKEGWLRWVTEHASEIKGFAYPGSESAFLNLVRQCFEAKPTRIQKAFKKLGIQWTKEMDEVSIIRGQYVHEGSPRERGYKQSQAQLSLMRSMLAVLYARIFGYEGPVSDYGDFVSEPSWWPVKHKDRTERITILAPTEGA